MGKYNGTFVITLRGDEYRLRPSFQALAEFEDKTGLAANEAFNQMMNGKMSIKVVAAAIWAGILGEALYQNNPKMEKGFNIVGELVRKEGLNKMVPHAIQFFTYGIIPEDDLEKLDKAEAEDAEKKSMQ